VVIDKASGGVGRRWRDRGLCGDVVASRPRCGPAGDDRLRLAESSLRLDLGPGVDGKPNVRFTK
jgi:hypothetical protein